MQGGVNAGQEGFVECLDPVHSEEENPAAVILDMAKAVPLHEDQ